jgi:hypothetical protein
MYRFVIVGCAIHLGTTLLNAGFSNPSIIYDLTDFHENDFIKKDESFQIVK